MNENDMMKYSGIGLPEDVQFLKDYGDFENALRLIDLRMKDDIPECLRQNYEVQKEIIRRLPVDFPYTKEEALEIAKKRVPDFTEEEFDAHIDRGRVTWHFVNGKMHFIESFFDNMVKEGYFKGREVLPEPGEVVNHEVKDTNALRTEWAKKMIADGGATARFTIRHEIRLKDESFVPGETYSVHLPIAASCIQQSEIELLSASPAPTLVNPEDADQRTVFWQEKMEENHPFSVEYSYLYKAPYVDPFTVKADPVQPDFFTEEEAPHIVFTPFIKALAAELTEGITDPVQKAWKFYEYITTKCKYSFVPHYFEIPEIADGCLLNRRGDCGVLALAFITLCRCAGIPARWQSGQVALAPDCGGHDWAQFYVAPYGWMFADCSFGGAAFRNGNELCHKLYFGNLDLYRLVTVNRFQSDMVPAQRFFRQDPYDNQYGEIECESKGFKRWEFDSSMTLVETKSE